MTAKKRTLFESFKQVCPNCKTELGDGMCCFTHTVWHCWGCGADLDSRVVTPEIVEID